MATPERWRLLDGGSHVVAFTATAGTSPAMGSGTYAVLLSCSANCHIRITTAGTAAVAANDWLLKATDPGLILGVMPGEKVSVVQDSAGGNLYVAELTA